MLEITNFRNGMILSTLSISSRAFAFGFPKKSYTNGDVFLMIIPLISQRETPLQQSSPQTKYTMEPPLRLMEPSNGLPFIEAQLLSLESTSFSRAIKQNTPFVRYLSYF